MSVSGHASPTERAAGDSDLAWDSGQLKVVFEFTFVDEQTAAIILIADPLQLGKLDVPGASG